MSTEVATDLCRVTIIAPGRRFDVVLPAGVALAYLLPALLSQAGDGLVDAGAEHGGWVLQRLGAPPLDTGQQVGSLGLRDGDLLYLRPRRSQLPPPVFDDVAEAIEWTLTDRAAHRDAPTGGTTARAAAGVLLAAGLGGLLAGGPPWTGTAVAAAVMTFALLVGAAVTARAFLDPGAGAMLGVAAVPYAFLATSAALARSTSRLPVDAGPQLLAGAGVAAAVLAVAAVAVGGGEAAFAAATPAVVACLVAGTVAGHTPPAGPAAAAIAVAFLAIPLIARLAYRMARLPAPFLPTSAEALRSDDATLGASRLSERSLIADGYVTALIAGAVCVLAVGGAFAATRDGWSGTTLVALLAVLAATRARLLRGRTQRAWLFALAVMTTVEATAGCVAHLPAPGRAAAAVGPAVIGLVAVTARVTAHQGSGATNRWPQPTAARLLDIVDMLAAVAVIPLVLQLLGVYARIRGLAG